MLAERSVWYAGVVVRQEVGHVRSSREALLSHDNRRWRCKSERRRSCVSTTSRPDRDNVRTLLRRPIFLGYSEEIPS